MVKDDTNTATMDEIAMECGDNPIKWAAALMADTESREITECEMIGWFTMAIEESNQIRSDREMDFAEKLAADFEDPSNLQSVIEQTRNPTRPSDMDILRIYLNKLLPWSFEQSNGLLHFKEGCYWVGVDSHQTHHEIDDVWINSEKLPKSWRGNSVIYYDKSAKGCPCCGFPKCGHSHKSSDEYCWNHMS